MLQTKLLGLDAHASLLLHCVSAGVINKGPNSNAAPFPRVKDEANSELTHVSSPNGAPWGPGHHPAGQPGHQGEALGRLEPFSPDPAGMSRHSSRHTAPKIGHV